ncbi:MAG: nucleoside kinase [Eubacterium sp.]
MDHKITIDIMGESRTIEAGTSLREIAEQYIAGKAGNRQEDIVAASVNGKLREIRGTIDNDSVIEFYTTATSIGHLTYVRSMTLLMLKAFNDELGDKLEEISVQYSISKGLYCILHGETKITQELLDNVKERMHKLVDEDIPITKTTVDTHVAIEKFREYGMHDKEKLFKFRRVSKVNLYSINKYQDYYYGYMVPSTGYLKYFELYMYGDGFVLQMPTIKNPYVVPPFEPQDKIFSALKEASEWSRTLDVNTVGGLNTKICEGKLSNIIMIQEALQEKKLAEMAQKIADKKNVKFVMIAGPSSSGKTTFSHRLSIQLMALGLNPHPIAVDNYFVNREDTPKDENGNNNYEILDAIDVEQFNADMSALSRGETVEMPVYNFKSGKREYKGNYLRLDKDDILVIEGIHCLNDKLSHSLPNESKFKIYISALTPLNIDEHNRIPTTDLRLIRRMVRDARTRGTSAKGTIAMWNSVRRGEEEFIFPYQETADEVFNSSLIYELSVLKQYAEPILFGIEPGCDEYMEAKRLLKFLDYFLGVSSEFVPNNSLLREFIGGSCIDC